MSAKKYLLEIGFDDAHLPELFNDDDKSWYKVQELMESYHQSKVKKLNIDDVSKCQFEEQKKIAYDKGFYDGCDHAAPSF